MGGGGDDGSAPGIMGVVEEQLVELSSDAGTSRVPLRGERLTIGRDAVNDLVLDDQPSVSRHHAELSRVDGAWSVLDLRSRNGTFLDGERLPAGTARLVPESGVIGVGSVTIRIVTAPVSDSLTVDDRGTAGLHRLQGALSGREKEVLALVAAGRTDDQVARELYISVKTVHSHLDRIRDKTGVRRRAELTRVAGRLGLKPPT